VRSASRKDAQFNKDISVDYPEEVGRIFCKKSPPLTPHHQINQRKVFIELSGENPSSGVLYAVYVTQNNAEQQ
jgi:hypothetical protein